MRILIVICCVVIMIMLCAIFWYHSIIRYNGTYTYELHSKGKLVGNGTVNIKNKVGRFTYSYRWPFIQHWPNYSDGGGTINLIGELKTEVDDYIVGGKEEVIIIYGNGYNDGIFDFHVGKSKVPQKAVIIHVGLQQSAGKLFLWASPYTDMKDFADMSRIQKSD